MSNVVFDRGMHQVIRATMACIGWNNVDRSSGAVVVYQAHRLSATLRCGHLAVHLVREADGVPVIIPAHATEVSGTILEGLTLMWSQNGGPNMGLPWGSIDFLFQTDGKVKLQFEGERTEQEDYDNAYLTTIHEAREKLYEKLYCETFPETILKLNHLFGVWRMGGLIEFQATKIEDGNNYHVLSSFGLSNPDMPSLIVATDLRNVKPGTSSALLVPKEKRPHPRIGRAGYGYELLIITKQHEDWTKFLMQWAVDQEIQTDVNFLAHVEGADGLTVENVPVGPNSSQKENILIYPAQEPWPQSAMLPNGLVKFLVMTVITQEEMEFAMKEGRVALVQKLREENIGQVSDLNRLAATSLP
jgi:Suppressor of fused protein (SUFU)